MYKGTLLILVDVATVVKRSAVRKVVKKTPSKDSKVKTPSKSSPAKKPKAGERSGWNYSSKSVQLLR